MKKLIFALIVTSFLMFGCSNSDKPEPVKDVNGVELNSTFQYYLPKGYTNLELIDTHWGYFNLDGHKYLLFLRSWGSDYFGAAITLVE